MSEFLLAMVLFCKNPNVSLGAEQKCVARLLECYKDTSKYVLNMKDSEAAYVCIQKAAK